jgi:hypothetical protein
MMMGEHSMMKPPLKIVSKISQVINVYSQPQKKEFMRKLQKKGVFQQDVLSMSAQHIQMMAQHGASNSASGVTTSQHMTIGSKPSPTSNLLSSNTHVSQSTKTLTVQPKSLLQPTSQSIDSFKGGAAAVPNSANNNNNSVTPKHMTNNFPL